MTDWEAKGFAVNRGVQRWDLERQVRLVAGSIVLTSILGSVCGTEFEMARRRHRRRSDRRGTDQYVRDGYCAVAADLQPGRHLRRPRRLWLSSSAGLPGRARRTSRDDRTDHRAGRPRRRLAGPPGWRRIDPDGAVLAYVGGMDPKPAIATSLLVVGVTSAIAAQHPRPCRAGAVAGCSGVRVGGDDRRLRRRDGGAAHSGHVLLVAFAVIMVAAGAAMLRGRKDTNGTVCDRPLRWSGSP